MEFEYAPARITRLRRPPRSLPWSLWCLALLDWPGFFWACFTFVWVLFLCFSCGDVRIGDAVGLRLYGRQAQGMVNAVRPLRTEIAGRQVYEVDYTYDDGSAWTAKSTAYDNVLWAPGMTGEVTFVPGKPGTARLRRLDQSYFGLFGPYLWFFVFAGLVFGAPSWLNSIQRTLLLRSGDAAEARVLELRKLAKTARDGRQLCRCAYEFAVHGAPVSGQSQVYLDDLDPALFRSDYGIESFAPGRGPSKPVLYLPGKPKVSMLVEALPPLFGVAADTKGNWLAPVAPLAQARFLIATLLKLAALFSVIGWLTGLLPNLGR